MITYEEIELRGIKLKDVEALNKNMGEIEINPLLSDAYYPLSSMGSEEFLKKKLHEVQEKKGYLFAIYVEGDGPLGLLELSKIDWKSRHAELSIWINKGFRERGYEKKAAIAALHFAFRELGMHKVVARCIENDAMLCPLYEKEISFAKEGRLREHCFHEGRYFSLLLFGMLEKEYASLFGTTEVAVNSGGKQAKAETGGLQEEHAF
ncbi:MAG: GNAT family N-acetyltransferase [Candidatus Micrarchaeia archaeon]